MKYRPVSFLPAVVLMIIPAVVLSTETNRPAALRLPPADWDAGQHRLAWLVATNKPGEYPLPTVWSGVEQVTARTGWYARKDAIVVQTNQWIEFDKFTVGRAPALPPRLRDERFISKGEGFPQAAYRVSLPSDSELLLMRDISSVTNLFRSNPFFSQSTNFAAQTRGIRLFTLCPYDAIETLQVTFMRRAGEDVIDSILVKRARLHPKP
jgi:hypothetical protein